MLTAPPGTPETLHLPVNSDPLLLNGAQATLIGWADTPLDGTNAITINNTKPNGFHDNLVEMPLDLDFTQNLNVPSNILQGNVIDEQNSDVELTAPDTYALTTGDVTFEFALPNAEQSSISSLTLAEPNAIYDLIHKTHPGVIGDLIQASLRVLLQVTNEDPSGLLLFAKPSLSLKVMS